MVPTPQVLDEVFLATQTRGCVLELAFALLGLEESGCWERLPSSVDGSEGVPGVRR